jgi:hypothetical protein
MHTLSQSAAEPFGRDDLGDHRIIAFEIVVQPDDAVKNEVKSAQKREIKSPLKREQKVPFCKVKSVA